MVEAILLLGLLSSLALLGCIRLLRSPSHPPNFPPGPPKLPLLGNMHQIPLQKAFLKLTELSRTYGSRGLMGLQFGSNTKVVVISNWRSARDLLEQRGALYSSRPHFHAVDLVMPPPGDYHLALLPYTPKWRKERKTFVEFLKNSEIEKRLPIQEAESSQLMFELLREPDRFKDHVFRYHGAIIMASVFGTRGKAYVDNSKVKRFFDVQYDWQTVLEPGYLPPLDIFPLLKYVPDYITPWRGSRERTRSVGQRQQAIYRDLFVEAKERIGRGLSQDCFMAELLRAQEKNGYSDVDLQYIGGVLMEGGSDTSAVTFETFILAMAAYPHILKTAQEEVDGFYGNDQMPTKTDPAELPFLEACLLEILRWRPILASGLAHATTQDDTYEEFFIPANTTIIMNIWGINHDPDVYENPDAFDPWRFLRHPKGIKVSTDQGFDETADEHLRRPVWTFGAGRRVCVGQHMAHKSLLLTMAKVVWCFDIEAHSSSENVDTSMDMFNSGILAGPKPFKANIRVRGENKKKIIEREWEKADVYLKQFE